MTGLDHWLSDARKVTLNASKGLDARGIKDRIAAEPTQAALVARHDVWRALCCSATAALIAFIALNQVGLRVLDKPGPTWVATPSAASPFALLIGK
ncbi:CnrY/NccY family anti-sigma factor [Cupriavidus basilensis]|uniref:CnrY/NccY family anti-sigma factor n=1 Tax=Cupriavidus basilensis TaxID=68895 RepID=UPI0009E1BB32|nr:CnrY/NccY family anti-sigma factor [Cupriavidus basilensis]